MASVNDFDTFLPIEIMGFRCLGLEIRSLIGWQESGGTDVARFARLGGVIAQFALK